MPTPFRRTPFTVESEHRGFDSAPELPSHPRFLHELAVVPFGQSVLVDGGHELQVLSGDAVSLLPRLIKNMDGTQTMNQLQSALQNTPPKDVAEVIRLLSGLSLIEDGNDEDSDANVNTLAFFRRIRGATGNNRTGWEGYEKLRRSEIVILDDGGIVEISGALNAALHDCGALGTKLLSWESLRTAIDYESASVCNISRVVVNISCRGEDVTRAEALDEWCSEHDWSWLRFVLDQSQFRADLGPLFNRRFLPCYRCFRRFHLKEFDVKNNPPAHAKMQIPDALFWAGMVALEIIYVVSGIGSMLTGRNCRRYDLRNWRTRDFRWGRVPDCPFCGGRESLSRPRAEVDTAMVFEDMIGLPSRAHSDYFGSGESLSTTLMPSRTQAKRLTNCSSRSLSRQIPTFPVTFIESMRESVSIFPTPVTIAELEGILLLTAGIRDFLGGGNVKRWMATAGNLGSVELYVIARNVSGLAPGVYYYEPFENRLKYFDRPCGTVNPNDFIRRVIPLTSDDLPDALLILTGAFHRVARKYGTFGYRLVSLDAGAATSQLRCVASGLGITSETAVRWADDLIGEQLNLRDFDEQVTGVVALSRRRSGCTQKSGFQSPKSTSVVRPAMQPKDFFECTVEDVLRRLYAESRINESNVRFANSSSVRQFEKSCCTGNVSVSLPPPASGGRGLGEILTERKSVRQFADAPIPLDHVSAMLHWAHKKDAEEWPEEHRQGRALTFVVLAQHTQDLLPAVYEYRPGAEKCGLQRITELSGGKDYLELFVQTEFAAAPVFFWIVGNLESACSGNGAFGHRQLLLRAGAAGHRLWMTGLAFGLSGCLVAGVIPGAARMQLLIDGPRRASLLGVAIGYERELHIHPRN